MIIRYSEVECDGIGYDFDNSKYIGTEELDDYDVFIKMLDVLKSNEDPTMDIGDIGLYRIIDYLYRPGTDDYMQCIKVYVEQL